MLVSDDSCILDNMRMVFTGIIQSSGHKSGLYLESAEKIFLTERKEKSMRKTGKHIVSKVLPGSIAEELEIEPGDELVSVSGKEIEDILDYHYLMNDEYVELLIRKPNGEEWELEIEKEYEDDIGIEFENGLMDDYKSCYNKCIFCL